MYEFCMLDSSKERISLSNAYWGELRVFAELARHKSASETAQRLGLSKPTIDRKVRRLQDLLGVQLFFSVNCKLQLTQRGEELAAALVALDASLSSVAADLRAMAGPLPEEEAPQGSTEQAQSEDGELENRVLSDDLTDAEWQEAKWTALALVETASLSSPESHLAYVRAKIKAVLPDVV